MAIPHPVDAYQVDCATCCGNGEIVTDWDRYLRSEPDDEGDEAVEDCVDCNGLGRVPGP